MDQLRVLSRASPDSLERGLGRNVCAGTLYALNAFLYTRQNKAPRTKSFKAYIYTDTGYGLFYDLTDRGYTRDFLTPHTDLRYFGCGCSERGEVAADVCV